ncbi:MAG: DNA translocase FtsK [Bacteroidales bacterium]|nr:DNA translocase FtsK [Bacteroidales bacterium]
MSRFGDYIAFWRNWDGKERSNAKVITGLLTGVFCLFILISCISYLFHWQQDMSLLGNPAMMDSATGVGNAAGKLGYRTGHLLIGDLFGLGSFALLIILVAISVRLIGRKWGFSLIKTTLLTLTGTMVASLLLAFVGNLAGIPDIFGGGLGGEFGRQVVLWGNNLFGLIICGAIILLLVILWLFFSSPRFTTWVYSLGGRSSDSDSDFVSSFETESDAIEAEEVAEETAAAEDASSSETAATLGTLRGGTVNEVNGGVERSETVEEEEPSADAENSLEVVVDDTLENERYESLPPIDNRLDPPEGLPKFKAPGLELLEAHASERRQVSNEELQRNNNKIRATLKNYKIEITEVKAQVGPTVTLYRVTLAPGVRISEVKKLQEDIGMQMNAKGVRVVTLSDSVGIEVANDYASIVPLKSLLNSEAFRSSKYELPVAIGYTITQQVKVFDLSDAPHLLVAGATKQGKSVGLNIIITSLLYAKHPSELKFVFIDPKMVEFSAYNSLLKHYLAVLPTAGDEEEERAKAIVKSAKDAELTLKSLCIEMDERYALLSKSGENKITDYNEKYKARKLNPKNGHRFLPYLVTIVDEYADLTMTMGASPEVRAASKSITNSIIRLAQKGRAAGIHVIIATQRPSVDVISGVIKGNFPLRIAFRVASRTDSMTIIDSPGAEKLIGRGDMLLSAGIENERIQCGFVSNSEIKAITNFIGDQEGFGKSYNTPYYLPEVKEEEKEGGAKGELGDLDERFEEAAKLVVTTQRGSTSDLQRRLGMGYAKAGRVMDQLEQAGIVGPQEGSKPRTVLVSTLDDLETLLDNLRNDA